MSASEPTTPHLAQDVSRAINGDCSKSKESQDPGLLSPDFETDQEGFQSPDFLGQDTDDNISHDSYNVLEKEVPKINAECMLTNSDSAVDKSSESEVLTALLINGTKESEGKSVEPLEICKTSLPSGNDNLADGDDHNDNEESKSKSHRHRVRVFSNHVGIGQTSPTLYARANRHLSVEGTEASCKAYPRTVDFVLVNQLPPIGSFSYKDDSVELKSPNKIKLEMLQHSFKSEKPNTCNNIPKSRPHPTGVDLLSDIMPSKFRHNQDVDDAGMLRKESALKVIADNLSATTLTQPSTSRVTVSADIVGAPASHSQSQTHVTVAEMHSNASDAPVDISKELAYHNFYQMVYLDMCRDEDVIDFSSHYNYNSYKFSQIGRPSNASTPGTSNQYHKNAHSGSHT